MAESEAQREYRESLEPTFIDRVEQSLPVRVGAEIASGINRPLSQLTDMLVTNPLNAVLGVFSDMQVPTVESMASPPLGTFVEGKPGEYIGTASEYTSAGLGGLAAIRQIPNAARTLVPEAQRIGANVLRQFQSTPMRQEAVISASAGLGAQAGLDITDGSQTGAMLGSIVGGTLPMVGVKVLGGIYNLVRSYAQSPSSKTLIEDVLAEQMTRAGSTPQEVVEELRKLGPDAIPADLNANFLRLLRTVSNRFPEVQALAARFAANRDKNQAGRIYESLSEGIGQEGATAQEAIASLDSLFTPKIRELYDSAYSRGLAFPTAIMQRIETNPIWKGYYDKALANVDAMRAADFTPGHLEVIDQMKREMDSVISIAMRNGDSSAAASALETKRILLNSIDVPEYAQARSLFSDKMSLNEALDQGTNYFKNRPGEIKGLLDDMNVVERDMFKLGAKDAILAKIENMQNYSDVTRLFSKNGDVAKMEALLGDGYADFAATLAREAQFRLTQRGIMGNSTSIQQLLDIQAMGKKELVPDLRETANNWLTRLFNSKDDSTTYDEVLRGIGDFLTEEGADPDNIAAILARGDKRRIQNLLMEVGVTVKDIEFPLGTQGNTVRRPLSDAASLNPSTQLTRGAEAGTAIPTQFSAQMPSPQSRTAFLSTIPEALIPESQPAAMTESEGQRRFREGLGL
tara:strand:+ start:121 stop:2184 length:2064 start_codon:yes stop_codon:yes gene_type:complete